MGNNYVYLGKIKLRLHITCVKLEYKKNILNRIRLVLLPQVPFHYLNSVLRLSFSQLKVFKSNRWISSSINKNKKQTGFSQEHLDKNKFNFMFTFYFVYFYLNEF